MQSSQDQEVSQKEAEEEVTNKPLVRQRESPQLVRPGVACCVWCLIVVCWCVGVMFDCGVIVDAAWLVPQQAPLSTCLYEAWVSSIL